MKPSGALADGVMVERKTLGNAVQMVTSPRQEALLIREGDKIQITLRTSFRAGPQKLAWVIPIPHEPESIHEADDRIFTNLETFTTPRFEMESMSRRHTFGCSGGNSVSRESIGRVAVMKTGQAGIYDYTVLTATGATALTRWLNDHGYNIPPGSEPVFRQYVEQGWCWLAIQLDAQRATGAVLAPQPIQYTYRDTRCIYPLVISQLSADESNEVLLYVLGDGYYECENWTTEVVPTDVLVPLNGTPSGTNYEAYFQLRTAQRGGHLFVSEFARDLNNLSDVGFLIELTRQDPRQEPAEERSASYLTRLRAVISRDAMDRDVTLDRQVRYGPVDPVHTLGITRRRASTVDATLVIAMMFVAVIVVRRMIPRDPAHAR